MSAPVPPPPGLVVASPRIERLRRRYQTEPAHVSVERARHYTAHFRSTEGSDLAREVRVAQAMNHVFRRMTHLVDPDDRIAGHWTEHLVGVPLDIERGVFNDVLAAELTRGRLLRARAGAAARAASYLVRRRAVGSFVRGQLRARAGGAASPLNFSLETLEEREINPFHVAAADRRELLEELLPWWKGRTLVDRLGAELTASGLVSADMEQLVAALQGGTSRQVFMLSTAATIASIQGHVILDYDRAVTRGLDALLTEARAVAAAAPPGPERDAVTAIALALEGVTVFADRLAATVAARAEQAGGARRDELRRMAARCARAPRRPAETFADAVQALWTVKTAVELAHPVNLHCFGRLDQTLEPLLAADLAAGRTTRAQARELLEELLLKVMAQNLRPESNVLARFYHRFFGSTPITVGGVRPDGGDATGEVTRLLVEAAHTSKAVTNLSIRVHPGTPDGLLRQVAGFLEQGTSSYSLFNDQTHVPAMERYGFAPADARDYAVMGCVEATCPGKTGSMSASALLLCRVLDLALRGGDAVTLATRVPGAGLPTGDPDGFVSFDQLLEAFFAQARHAVDLIARASNLRDDLYARELPAPFVSAFMDGCLERRRDVTRGGARYDLAGVSLINSIANVTDALRAVERLVFRERRFTVRELLAAADANFVGHDEVRRAIDGLEGRWGNGDPEVDALARRVLAGLIDLLEPHRTSRGGPFVPYVISMTTHTIDGRLSPATVDGRRAATPFAASCNPANVEEGGVTAALRSVAALPHDRVPGGAVNVRFHPTAIGKTEAARAKWVELIRAYFALGGAQLQPTCASGEVLRAAQRDPDAHRDLVVKVGGYSTYFVDLGAEIQAEVIARTEHREPGEAAPAAERDGGRPAAASSGPRRPRSLPAWARGGEAAEASEATQGWVFDVQPYALHDGPGIRTTVHLKGCPLRCWWCHNPEGQRRRPEVTWSAERCAGCGACARTCPAGAVALGEDGAPRRDRGRCSGCGACARACPTGAVQPAGHRLTVADVLARVAPDAPFFGARGGLTVTGGEPTAQPGFLFALLAGARRRGLHTAVETCGLFPPERVADLAAHADLVLFDLKHTDPARHRQGTGVDCAPILANFAALLAAVGPERLTPRVPVIRGFNADAAAQGAIAAALVRMGYRGRVDLMPGHDGSRAKYERLDRAGDYRAIAPIEDAERARIDGVYAAAGLTVRWGG